MGSRRAAGIALGVAGLLVALGMQRPAVLPEWKYPDPALDTLDVEYRTEDWALRPPRDADPRRKVTENEIQIGWTLKRGGETVADLSVITLALRSDRNKAETVVDRLLARLRRGASGKTLEAEPLEHGTLNGNHFVRVRYRLKDRAGAESEGFLYVTDATRHVTALGGSASPEWNRVIQSALHTFVVIE